MFNGTAARYKVVSKTFIWAWVLPSATTGFVTVTASGKTLKSNVKFRGRNFTARPSTIAHRVKSGHVCATRR
jgi:hypothetical protein